VYSSVAAFNTGALGGGGNSSCSQPSNLDALLLSNTSVELSWSAIQEAANYTVQYRIGQTGTFTVVGPVTGTSLVLNGLLQNTEYQWQVKASCSDYSSLAVFTTGGTPGGGNGGGSSSCSAPSNTNTNAVFPTSAQVSWEAVGGALDYTVQYKTEIGGSYITVGTFTVANATITGLLPNTQYVWRVKANCSPYGSDVQFSTPAAMVAGTGTGTRSTFSSDVIIAPNPVTSRTFELIGAPIGAQVTVMNAVGQLMINENITDFRSILSAENLEPGMYFLSIIQDGGLMETKKLVIAQ
jgi:Fibronectin type III domain